MSSLFFFPTSPPSLTKEKLHFFGVSTTWREDTKNQHRPDIVCPPYRLSVSKTPTQVCNVVPQGQKETVKEYVVLQDEAVPNEISIQKDIKKRVGDIKSILKSLSDGEISISAYDTAWVALIESEDSGKPLFPSSLRWIVENQLPDGSWGDPHFFSAQDRSISTLACLVALKSWNIHPEMCDRGMLFLKENLHKIKDEKSEHMLIGFEVAFPSIVEMAQELGIQVLPKNSPLLRDIYAKRQQKLNRIPKEKIHKEPTSLLFSLEGLKVLGLNWKDILKWQSSDGSFLFSLSSTAFAFMQTRDPNCFNYLNKVVNRFNGGVPNVYPVHLFEHVWVVDRLQRLGISQYFKEEIKECMANMSRYWTEQGIFCAKDSPMAELDSTAMGFRLLRFHGHQVSADVFEQFKSGSNFYTLKGQSSESITAMFNLLRASQLQFPGEEVLEDAKRYSTRFLKEKREANQLFDKWIITKDLPGEVGYGLDVPWYASLPRVEARFYIEHYGGSDDVWIGKTLYRMPYVSNNKYLELAKLDYNNCQAMHISEWDHIQRWYSESDIGEFGISGKCILLAYFVASSSIYEVERSRERIVWAKISILVDTIASFFGTETTSTQRKAFVRDFKTASAKGKWVPNKVGQGLIGTLVSTLNQLSLDKLVADHGRNMYSPLRDAWVKWLVRWEEDGDKNGGLAELLVQSINIVGGRCVSSELLSPSQPPNCFHRLTQLSDQLISHLLGAQISFSSSEKVEEKKGLYSEEVESAMQELVQLVLCDDDGMDKEVKQTFLTVVKSFYYTAFFDSATIDFHISKVLFDRVN